MILVEVDGDDLFGIGGEVIEDVAAAGSNGDNPVMRLDLQCFQIDVRIFPNLVVDEALEKQREQAFEGAPFRGGRPRVRGAFKKQIGHRCC